MKPEKQYVLAQDNDGHWYVVPDQMYEDFVEWLDDPYYPGDGIPSYAFRVGGAPCLVKFSRFVIT